MLELSAPWIMYMDARKRLAWLYFSIKQKVKLLTKWFVSENWWGKNNFTGK